jgi:hypothetical protein
MPPLKFGPRKYDMSPEEWARANAYNIATSGGKFGSRKIDAAALAPVKSGSGEGHIPPPPADRTDLLPVRSVIPIIQDANSPLEQIVSLELARKGGPRVTVLSAIRDQAEARKIHLVVDLANAELARIVAQENEATGTKAEGSSDTEAAAP